MNNKQIKRMKLGLKERGIEPTKKIMKELKMIYRQHQTGGNHGKEKDVD